MNVDSSHSEQPLQLPRDLIAEVERQNTVRQDEWQVEGWKPSLFSHIVEMLGRKSR